jgi:hypothetical protein
MKNAAFGKGRCWRYGATLVDHCLTLRSLGKTKVLGTIVRTDGWGFWQLMVPNTFIHPQMT